MSCPDTLCSEQIKNRKDFLKWSMSNHPDKCSADDQEKCKSKFQSISGCINDAKKMCNSEQGWTVDCAKKSWGDSCSQSSASSSSSASAGSSGSSSSTADADDDNFYPPSWNEVLHLVSKYSEQLKQPVIPMEELDKMYRRITYTLVYMKPDEIPEGFFLKNQLANFKVEINDRLGNQGRKIENKNESTKQKPFYQQQQSTQNKRQRASPKKKRATPKRSPRKSRSPTKSPTKSCKLTAVPCGRSCISPKRKCRKII